MTTTSTPTEQPPSLTGWQARGLHTITCPSGQRLRIRIPGIATLLEHGDLPDELIEIALLEVSRSDGAAGAIAEEIQNIPTDATDARLERLHQFAQFQRHLVCAAIAAVDAGNDRWEGVTLTPDALDGLPEDDLAMVAEIVQRLRGTDARGVRIGVEPIDRWARFHEAHGLDPQSCEACASFLQELSSTDVGAV